MVFIMRILNEVTLMAELTYEELEEELKRERVTNELSNKSIIKLLGEKKELQVLCNKQESEIESLTATIEATPQNTSDTQDKEPEDVDERIQILKAQLDTQITEMQTQQSQISDKQALLDVKEQRIVELESEKGQWAEERKKLELAKAEIEEAKALSDSAKAEVDAVASAQTEAEVETLRTELEALRGELESTKKAADEKVAYAMSRMEAMASGQGDVPSEEHPKTRNARGAGRKKAASPETVQMVLKLRETGVSYVKISQVLKERLGVELGRTTVGEIVRGNYMKDDPSLSNDQLIS